MQSNISSLWKRIPGKWYAQRFSHPRRMLEERVLLLQDVKIYVYTLFSLPNIYPGKMIAVIWITFSVKTLNLILMGLRTGSAREKYPFLLHVCIVETVYIISTLIHTSKICNKYTRGQKSTHPINKALQWLALWTEFWAEHW